MRARDDFWGRLHHICLGTYLSPTRIVFYSTKDSVFPI
jgi:hypothetical protein